MSETTMFDDGWVSLDFDEDLYPLDAIHGAAYVLLERAYLFLERTGHDGGLTRDAELRTASRSAPQTPGSLRLRVWIKAKSGDAEQTAALAGDLENEALAQAYRRRLAAENRALIESIASRALAGAAGPPGLDDLLAMDIGAETAFDDPLGIALSWEEKYAKKKSDNGDKEPP
jgi:hypothetical protein